MDVQAEVLAGAEGTADATQGQPHQLGFEAEALGDLVAVVVQPLRRHDQLDAAVVGRQRQPGLGTEERLVLHADLVGALDDDRAVLVGIALAGCGCGGTRCRRGGSTAESADTAASTSGGVGS